MTAVFSKRLSLCVDCRSSDPIYYHSYVVTVVRQTTALLVLARLQGAQIAGNQNYLCVTLYLLFSSRVEVLLDGASLYGSHSDLQALYGKLSSMEHTNAESPTKNAVQHGSLEAVFAILQIHHPPHSAHLFCLVSMCATYTELFSSFVSVAASHGPSFATNCVAVDRDAVCTTSAALSPTSRVIRCMRTTTDICAVLQQVLMPFILPSASMQVRIRVGTCALRCVAERSYLTDLSRCCVSEDFPVLQEGHLGTVFRGACLWSSNLERARCLRDVVPTLYLEAVLPPEHVCESFLFENPWVLSTGEEENVASTTDFNAHLFDAFYTVYQKDALVLASNDPHLCGHHQLALEKYFFIGYFLNRSQLLLRQIVPYEMRRFWTTRCSLRRQPDSALLRQMEQARNDLLLRVTSDGYLFNETLHGGLLRVSLQMTPHLQHHLQLARRLS